MKHSAAAAPESGDTQPPTFEELAADPEIAALLDFDPAPRQIERPDGWTAELQRELVARIADTGSPGRACAAMGKHASGAKHLCRGEAGASLRAAWKAAIALFRRRARERRAAAAAARHDDGIPAIASPGPAFDGGRPGDVLNEFGEWEDPHAYRQRMEEAQDSIVMKLLRCRRAYLASICHSPGKRAAFEILTELPIDWDKASRLEPQADEPYNIANQRQPDMVLTAESGWLMGEIGYGPDRKREAREAIDRLRVQRGEDPIDWSA